MHRATDHPNAGCKRVYYPGAVLNLNKMCLLYNIFFHLSTPFLNIFLFFEEFFSLSFIFLQKWPSFCKNLTVSFIFDAFLCISIHILCRFLSIFKLYRFCAQLTQKSCFFVICTLINATVLFIINKKRGSKVTQKPFSVPPKTMKSVT